MIIALAMPALIGGAGFAVDTAQWYLWQKELQHSVDQAAMAGAWELSKDADSTSYWTRALQEYSANLSVTSDFASRPKVSLVDYAGGTDNSVLVSATASKSLPFSSMLTGEAATVLASAQASFAVAKTFSACLKALKPTDVGFEVGGNATIKAQCGLVAKSCSDGAITIDGSSTVETASIAACGTVTAPDELDDVITEGVTGISDDFADLPTPQAESTAVKTLACSGNGSSAAAYPTAGTYNSFVVSCKTTLGKGVYVIDGGVLDLTANYNVTGNSVLFVLKNGASLKLGGSGNDNNVTLTPMQAADFAGTKNAAYASRYQGMLVFEDKNNSPGNVTHIMNGNSTSIFEGVIYLPVNELRINGTANVYSQCLLISAYKIKFLGNAFLETLCPVDESLSAGALSGGIKLVA